jgi:diketogulonate reductase-like aldo/keto reductase
MGEQPRRAGAEARALALGIELGMTLIDTAEMYGEGGAAGSVGRGIGGRRRDVFIVSKVYPHNAGRRSTIAACERSLARLGTDHLDLYLLHWRGSVPLAETVDAFEQLRRAGKILRWGVSNFDTDDMRRLWALPEGRHCATNQVLYHLAERGIEWSLLPWMREQRMPLMAYSPLGQGELLGDPRLARIAAAAGATPAQVGLAWLLRQGDVMAIPQSCDPAHVRANRAAADLVLDAAALAALERAFPAPSGKTPLAML